MFLSLSASFIRLFPLVFYFYDYNGRTGRKWYYYIVILLYRHGVPERTRTPAFIILFMFFFYINDDLCYRDTPFFVGEIRAAAASVRRSHVARLPRSPNPYAHLPLPTAHRRGPPRPPRCCKIAKYVRLLRGWAGGQVVDRLFFWLLLLLLLLLLYYYFVSGRWHAKTESKTLYNVIYDDAFTRAIIYLCYAHVSICVH